MKIISHRGNTHGPNILENSPKLLLTAIENGFDVEVDIRFINNNWYLGHDDPRYLVDQSFINQIKEHAWFHCKNLQALEKLNKNIYRFFWHQNDSFTLTSNGYIWTYPNQETTLKSIIVDLNLKNKYKNVYGICTDYPSLVK
jgi:hypothetical protein